MEPKEPTTVVIPAGSELIQLEQQLEKEVLQIEEKLVRSETAAWLRELSSFATAMIVTTAAVALAGVVVVLFCYAFQVTVPLTFLALTIFIARGVRRHRSGAQARQAG